MRDFDSVSSIEVISTPEVGLQATFKMRLRGDAFTLYQMYNCLSLLESSFGLFFPGIKAGLDIDDEKAEFTYKLESEYSEHESETFDLFFRALISRYPHIKYSAHKKLPELAPWN